METLSLAQDPLYVSTDTNFTNGFLDTDKNWALHQKGSTVATFACEDAKNGVFLKNDAFVASEARRF